MQSFDIVNIYSEHVMNWPHVAAAALAHGNEFSLTK